MTDNAPLSLRGPKTGKEAVSTKLKNFRCPLPLEAWLKETSQALGRDQTEIILSAMELERDLALKLGSHLEKLDAYAQGQGLTLDRDLAEVLAQLVRKALEKNGKKAG